MAVNPQQIYFNMIDKLILKNFQAHKSSELDFCPNVNCIIGESDEGKTSIIRALYWASQNKPSGGDFISDFSKRGECSASIVVGDNGIERVLEFHTNKKQEKVIDRNAYWANDQEFKALGKSGVPDEVSKILQLDELNFQNQMDSPFLLSSSSGEVARYLNDIVNLNVIDDSLKKVNAKTNECNRDIKFKEDEVGVYKTELEKHQWIEQAEKELLQLEDDHLEFKNRQSLQEYLIDVLEDADDLVDKLKPYKDLDERLNTIEILIQHAGNWLFDEREFQELTEHLNVIDDLVESIAKFKDQDDELYQISLLVKEWESWNSGVNQLDSFKSDLNSVKTISDQIGSLAYNEKEIESLIDLTSSIGVYNDNHKRFFQFETLMVDIDLDLAKIKQFNKNIKITETEFERDFPDTCPLCSQEIN